MPLIYELRKVTLASGESPGEAVSVEFLDCILRAMGEKTMPDSDEEIAPDEDLLEPLTNREIGVLEKVALGLSNDEVADQLCVSKSTVRTHLRNINSKLGVKSRTEAVALARRYELIK